VAKEQACQQSWQYWSQSDQACCYASYFWQQQYCLQSKQEQRVQTTIVYNGIKNLFF